MLRNLAKTAAAAAAAGRVDCLRALFPHRSVHYYFIPLGHGVKSTQIATAPKFAAPPRTPHARLFSFSITTTAASLMSSTREQETSASRRERVARAAEQRRAQPGAAMSSLGTPTTTTTTNNNNRNNRNEGSVAITAAESVAKSSKRSKASAPEDHDASAQIGFSDSDGDGGGDSEVLCLGVSRAVGSGSGRCGGARKRGKREEATTSTPALGAGTQRGLHHGAETSVRSDPKLFRVVSWNIDCLNPENKFARVEEVCAIILESEERLLPDVILLQEVDADMVSMLNARLGVGGRYRAFPPSVPVERRYFTLVFVRVGTVKVEDSGRKDFRGSKMGRDLTSLRCTFNGKPLLVLTSHFESEKQNSDERKAQFSQALRALLDFGEGPALFAGDTNLREAEVKQEKLAKQAGDMWQLCGADPKLRFTWDMANNDNHVFGGGFKPRARYDRMFVNPEAKACAKTFTLLGTERMAPPDSCFPSDHFGIDASFEW